DGHDILRGIKKTLQQAFCNWRKLHHQLHSSSKESSTEFFPEIDLKRRSSFRLNFSDINPITRRKFKTSALNGSEYFTSLEMSGKSKSQMTLKTAIHGVNIASKLFDEVSHSSFNFGESENSIDFSISTKVNSLMADATDVDEKFAMMEQTIGALKKSLDDKNLQLAQLMSKLDLYNSRKSHHNLTTQEKVDIDSPTKPVDFQSAKRSALFGSFEPTEVSALKKITSTSKHQGTSKLRLSKVDTKSSTNQLRQCKSIKSNSKSKYINASSQRVRRTVTLMEFFPEMLLDGLA
ncbi:hypothetical protein H5410_006762, partial [Solanum commersonii]